MSQLPADTQQGNIADFITRARISAEAREVDRNPHMETATDPKWQARHYKVTLYRAVDGLHTRQFTLYFSQGMGIDHPPTAADVLDCLASDAGTVEDQTFENWAADLGFDPDSRSAERTFRLVQDQTRRLCKFLGDDLYAALVWNTSRL